MKITYTLNQINEVAQKILDQNPQKIIIFNGEMGVGKTTLIKAICTKLGVIGATSSPTFSLVNEYETNKNLLVFHFDVYRLKSETEALDMGIDDYLYSGNWCFIEWAEKIPNLIPSQHSIVNIELLENEIRLLNLKL